MRILLVTLQDILPFAITQVLNPANEYCAIVTDEVEPAKNFVKSIDGSENLIHPFYELKECIENFYYDVVICVCDMRIAYSIYTYLKKYKLPQEKFLNICLDSTSDNFFLMKRAMRYFSDHADEFEIFSTGISYTVTSIDARQFKRKLFNFGRGSQDLYFDYQLAKFAISRGGGLIYSLIGLAPYSFHYDESKSYRFRQRIFQYCIALNDLHRACW